MRQAPEQRQRVHELAEHGGQLRAPAEYGRLRGQPLRRPEPTRGPVREGPGDAQLAHQGEDVVVLRASSRQLQTSAGCGLVTVAVADPFYGQMR